MSGKKWAGVLLLLVVIGALFYANGVVSVPGTASRPQLELITGGSDAFWDIVVAGAEAAAAEHRADLSIRVAEKATEQTKLLLEIDPAKVDGVAVSPIDPGKQTRTLSSLATRMNVLTMDNDAPESLRHCHVGTNNYVAGLLCGETVKKALPDGGKIAIFVGHNTTTTARLRRQGVIDALTGEYRIPGEGDNPLDQPIEAASFTILETFIDGGFQDQAQKNVAAALEKYPEVDLLVGLYGYSGPMCLKALADAGKLGDVKVVAFDEHLPTLQGIDEGHVFATIVQDPYQYGFESVRILAALTRGSSNAAPMAGSGTFYLPCSMVNKDNLIDFREKYESRISLPVKEIDEPAPVESKT